MASFFQNRPPALFFLFLLLAFTACDSDERSPDPEIPETAVLLIIDEESIDNGNEPNNFSETDVNDQLAEKGVRKPLDYFEKNIGKSIVLYTGLTGDEGWHAIKTIPDSWETAGPTNFGGLNFLAAGPGLGTGNDDAEKLLDKVPDVTPLRATGLSMLVGQTVLAIVYDGDISINYGPLNGSLKGENLGLVAFEVMEVQERNDGSDKALPKVVIRIVSVTDAMAAPLVLFTNAPVPQTSSEPADNQLPASVPAGIFELAP